MYRIRTTVGAALVLGALLWTATAIAESDHLVGYKVKESVAGAASSHSLVDALATQTCEVSRAKYYFATAAKDGGDDPLGGPALSYECYKAKCDGLPNAALTFGDQFGAAHSVTAVKAKLVCAPVSGQVVSACEASPATGQTTCWNPVGIVTGCAGTGYDGELQTGATLAYTVDSGNGTVTDNNTGLMWEKLSDDGSIHDIDTTYTWNNAFAVKVATLNSSSFAGYTDWRVPNYKELVSIINLQNIVPSVSSAFNTSCSGGCAYTTCSCTQTALYWSSSTYRDNPIEAWGVNFFDGYVYSNPKSTNDYVRAVRGGSGS